MLTRRAWEELIKKSNDGVLFWLQGFSLEFHFSENEHFTNKVLTKTYTMSCALPEDDPFSFEGATITNVKGYVGGLAPPLSQWLSCDYIDDMWQVQN